MHRFFPSRLLAWFLALSFLVSCGGDEPIDPTPVTPIDPNPPTPEKDTTAPTITVSKSTINIISGPSLTVSGNELKIGSDLVASWKDDKSTACTVTITFVAPDGTSKTVNSGDKLSEEGKLQVKVSDEAGNSSTSEITLTAIAVYGLENLQGKTFQIDQEVNLLEGLTFAEGLSLQKVEIEQEGVRSEIPNPRAYIPELPGTVSIILTLAKADGSTIEVWVDNLTIKGLEYQSISINSIKSEEILPVIWQVNWWDKHVYDHIEHLRIAEAARVIDMMGKYGAGDYSSEEYKVLLKRLNTWMTGEEPKVYDNFEIIGGATSGLDPTNHAYTEYGIMNDVIVIGKYSNLKIVSEINDNWYGPLSTFVKEHSNTINIFWNSFGVKANTRQEYEESVYRDAIINLCKEKNFVLFASWSNVNGQKIKAFNWVYELDEFGQYANASMANSDKNNLPDLHLYATFSTDEDWDADLSNRNADSSKFPVGFNKSSVFSGRAFPVHDFQSWLIVGRSWNLPTSDPNYLNVTLADLCFQVRADVKDVDELMDMIRSTALINYIRLDMNGDGDTDDVYNGQPETQPLQLINPAGVLKKYCLLSNIPTSISAGEVITLTKEWYKGLIFDIPGAEVKVNGEWIAYDAKNKNLILSQNPMNLEWRLNGSLLRKYGYASGQTLQGQIITVDDQWDGLRLEKDITIQIN